MGKLLKSFLTAAVETSGNNKVPSAREIANGRVYEAEKARLKCLKQLENETDPDKIIEMEARLRAKMYDFSDL